MDNTNMNETIKRIISIDDEARKIINTSEEKGKNIDQLVKDELDRRKVEIDEAFENKEKAKIQEQEKEISLIRQKKQIEVEYKIKKIEKEYHENEEGIISKVLTRITKI